MIAEVMVLRSAKKDPSTQPVTEASIRKVIFNHFGRTFEELAVRSRKMSVRYPRQVSMYLLTKYTSLSYSQIGDLFDDRDHTTVIAACQRIQDLLDTEEGVFLEIRNITQKLISMSFPLIDSEEVLVSHYRRVLEILGKLRSATQIADETNFKEDKDKKKYWEQQADTYLHDLGCQPMIKITKP